jgi:hypothetical protein
MLELACSTGDFWTFERSGFLASGFDGMLLNKHSFCYHILSNCSCLGTIDLYMFKSSVFAITCDR